MIKKYIPTSLKRYIKLKQLKRKFPNAIINTKKVHATATLGYKTVLYEGTDIRRGVKIGDYTLVNVDTIICTGIIGKFSSIGPRCQIGMPEHPVDHMSTSPFIYNRNRSILNLSSWLELQKPPVIGNDVWIGANVVILQGVKIGDGAIVGAGAVVTNDVEPYSIVGGVPAKLIRKRFDEKTIQYLLDLKWWDLPVEELREYKHLFEAGSSWINEVEIK